MVKIDGKYKLQKNENFVEHLVAHGASEENAKKVDALRPTIEVIQNGKQITINSDSGIDNASSTFTLDQEGDEKMPLGFVVKSTAKLDGSTLTITSKADGGKVGTRTYKFSDSGAVLTMTSDDSKIPTAIRTYQKL